MQVTFVINEAFAARQARSLKLVRTASTLDSHAHTIGLSGGVVADKKNLTNLLAQTMKQTMSQEMRIQFYR